VGGVSANKRLRQWFEQSFDGTFYTPTAFGYCTDNAAMIGAAWLAQFTAST
jgi:tRNA A37 threonylcarbamoyltransferase TsaD